eukprot:gnl/Spiro4/6125_TR3150_c0_g1_i2.p1 gnl/Spiro4/6125_TR3150_c0_g1~~gnl/Spiro4/6125_TR3150_c0_g1_i2.p1  ORF type:complete len:757 (+),score=250.93 gnl/Spiro4/6125_TR3150_c0_g1_i2:32-2272(+)
MAAASMHIAAPTTANSLPLCRVVLYKHGIANFERRGAVSGDTAITFSFKGDEMNDVLKSLTVMDLSGHGAIASISYDNDKPTERRLWEGAIHIDGSQACSGFLQANRGALVRVAYKLKDEAAEHAEGLVVGTDNIRKNPGFGYSEAIGPCELQLLCEGTFFRSIPVDCISSVQLLDNEMRKGFAEHMSILKAASNKDLKQLTIFATGTGERTVQVSYTLEAPMWKASYRIILPRNETSGGATATTTVPAQQPAPPVDENRQRCHIQGWAIVDNITDEKWDGIQLVLISGEPHSHEYDLFTPRYKRQRTVPDAPALSGGMPVGGMGGPAGMAQLMRQQQMMQQIQQRQVMQQMQQMQQIQPQQQQMRRGGGGRNVRNSVRNVYNAPLNRCDSSNNTSDFDVVDFEDNSGVTAATTTEEMGDLFKYTISHPVTVNPNQSALVPIVSEEATGSRVAIWNPERHSSSNHPNSAVYFTNTTGLTLEQGPVAILEGSTYVGEAILPTVQPGETKFVEFSTERAVELWKTETSRSQVFRSRIAAGVMIQTSHRTHVTKYNIRSKATRNITLYIEHRFKKGTTLVSEAKPTNPKPIQFYIFKTKAEADKQTEFVVEEQQEEETRVELSGQCSHRSIKAWLSEHVIDQETKRVLDRYCDLISTSNTHGSSSRKKRDQLRQIEQKQGRIRENLKAMGRSNQEVSLREKYVRELEADEDAISALENEIVTEETERDRVAEQAQALLRSITFTTEVRH